MKSIITKTLTAALLVFSAATAAASARIASPARTLKTTEKDPCNEAFYELESKSINVNQDKSGLSFLIVVKLTEKSANPSSMKVILTLQDCKGNEQFVSVELKYNEKTGEWTGTQYLLASSECVLQITDHRLLAFNPCGDEYEAAGFNKNRPIRDLKEAGKLPARDRIIERRRRG